MDKDVKTVMATVYTTSADRITAFDCTGLMHQLFWNGKSPVYKSLKPGDVVMVHYTPTFEGEVHAFEIPQETSSEPRGEVEEAEGESE